jgi:Na+/melibiose symporter-like transporter
MTINPYAITLYIATLFGWASWVLVIMKLDPFSSTPISLILFYASFFVAIAGTLAILNYYLRLWLGRKEAPNKHFYAAVRQGVLLSMMFNVGLGFQRLKVLTWWDALLLLLIILLVEFYFMSND